MVRGYRKEICLPVFILFPYNKAIVLTLKELPKRDECHLIGFKINFNVLPVGNLFHLPDHCIRAIRMNRHPCGSVFVTLVVNNELLFVKIKCNILICDFVFIIFVKNNYGKSDIYITYHCHLFMFV